MVGSIVRKVFGSKNDRQVKKMGKLVKKINAQEEALQKLSDEALTAKTEEFKKRLEADESIDDLLVEAFAVVREASVRVMKMRHFDEQMIGGMTLHDGKIAEMRTGEGKTLVATLPAYLNALSGEGVHVITVNDYLASRDALWMAPIFEFLGMTVGIIRSGQSHEEKKQAYAEDITYGTNNEYGFDYLRDNMAFSLDAKVQRGVNFAIIDEVDSILIDEARTPLIISGQSDDSSALYIKMNLLIPKLERQEFIESLEERAPDTGHYTLDEKSRQVELTELGHEFVETWLVENGLLDEGDSLYSPSSLGLFHHLYAALKAHVLFKKDVEYIVRNNEIIIVDEHTGRTMPGRRWSEGIHQAVEAKEGVKIENESQTLASTTFQNYFRLYNKLSGMTGTADTEAFEFRQIYGLDVIVIPTHRPMVRKDHNDLIYMSQEEKYEAIVEDIEETTGKGQPVLVGTASIEASEIVSGVLKKKGIEHYVLNAKHHEKEAEIITQAGMAGRVTIATNMAGRGTDIVLGGNWEAQIDKDKADEMELKRLEKEWQKRHDDVLAAGGLHIICTERHESRRIDNQLRGRSGRQGDPGSSRFYLSMEDSLMRIFASDKVKNLMQTLGMERGDAIEHRWVTRSIENAQRKVEGRNFDMRKQLLEYDDVANDQRRVIYQQRNDILESDDISENVESIRGEVIEKFIDLYVPPQSIDEQWEIETLTQELLKDFRIELPLEQWLADDKSLDEAGLREKIAGAVLQAYEDKEARVSSEVMRQLEKQVMLEVLDRHWKEHLANMDHLRQGIGLRGYAQKNPKQEYKREAFELFQSMMDNIQHEVISILSRLEVRQEQDVEAMENQRRQAAAASGEMEFTHEESSAMGGEEEQRPAAAKPEEGHTPFVRDGKKVGRNEPCPCGSGKKFKQCHGKLNG